MRVSALWFWVPWQNLGEFLERLVVWRAGVLDLREGIRDFGKILGAE